MLLLMEYCIKYFENGLIFPRGVEIQTKKYKESVDCYENFFSETIVRKEHDAVSWTMIRQLFVNWYKENINEKTPNAKEIKKYFINKFGKNDKKCKDIDNNQLRGWKGWSIKINDE